MTSPLALLLKFQGYPPAVLFTSVLHGILLYLLLGSNLGPSEFVDVDRPVYIAAAVIQENPQRLRRLQDLEQQRQAQELADQRARESAARARAEQEAREQAEREAQTRQREVAAQRERELAAAREREAQEARQEAQRREREQQAREQAEREALTRQAVAAQQAEQAAANNQNVQAYSAVIHDAVAGNWSIPPSARNGMSVLLGIQLVPTGEVVGVNVIQSSGDAAFDRSAMQAVAKAGRFPELQGMPISLFERNFRTFYLNFTPEDLLR